MMGRRLIGKQLVVRDERKSEEKISRNDEPKDTPRHWANRVMVQEAIQGLFSVVVDPYVK